MSSQKPSWPAASKHLVMSLISIAGVWPLVVRSVRKRCTVCRKRPAVRPLLAGLRRAVAGPAMVARWPVVVGWHQMGPSAAGAAGPRTGVPARQPLPRTGALQAHALSGAADLPDRDARDRGGADGVAGCLRNGRRGGRLLRSRAAGRLQAGPPAVAR